MRVARSSYKDFSSRPSDGARLADHFPAIRVSGRRILSDKTYRLQLRDLNVAVRPVGSAPRNLKTPPPSDGREVTELFQQFGLTHSVAQRRPKESNNPFSLRIAGKNPSSLRMAGNLQQKVVIQASCRDLRRPFWGSRLPLSSPDLPGGSSTLLEPPERAKSYRHHPVPWPLS